MHHQNGLQRRTLLQAGSLATLAGALPGFAGAAEPMTEAPDVLGAWIRTNRDGKVLASVAAARAGAGWRTLGEVEVLAPGADGVPPHFRMTGLEAREKAAHATRAVLKEVAARAWRVSPADCDLEAGRVRDRVTGKEMPYRLWLQV